ncbi:protein kinase [Halobacteriovorax sp. GB3]|uniref:protein kinase domain-containing protein n=1 Tax=Halobacteriovorax sp. GB3 TaxID=2719615 RepID=UPI00236038A3|nr:protein kinase [Halobacteriovorax sp. GB3]MDD0851812.1 protein kinase [Halobacteriovorax sp. GB3]
MDFNFPEGKILSKKYEIVQRLGGGLEGEVYLVRELGTGIERAAKFFYPSHDWNKRKIQSYAKKLHKLSSCNSLIKYVSKESMIYNGQEVTYLLSEFVEGSTLCQYMDLYYKKGLPFYQALHILYAVVKAVEEIHLKKEVHGDVHEENIIIQKSGLKYEIKLIDVFHQRRGAIQDDVIHMCQLLYYLVGGKKKYAKQPSIIKGICLGQKQTLIRKKFKNPTMLRIYLENTPWEEV